MSIFEREINGVCCKKIILDFDDNTKVINNVTFVGGCPGNLSAIAKLVVGKTCQECFDLFSGHKCGNRPTSCMDQFSLVLKDAINLCLY